jgi:hypothetical protein
MRGLKNKVANPSCRMLALTVVLAVLACRCVSAATLYVAPDGDDRWSSSIWTT